jgi:hypothetical protein
VGGSTTFRSQIKQLREIFCTSWSYFPAPVHFLSPTTERFSFLCSNKSGHRLPRPACRHDNTRHRNASEPVAADSPSPFSKVKRQFIAQDGQDRHRPNVAVRCRDCHLHICPRVSGTFPIPFSLPRRPYLVFLHCNSRPLKYTCQKTCHRISFSDQGSLLFCTLAWCGRLLRGQPYHACSTPPVHACVRLSSCSVEIKANAALASGEEYEVSAATGCSHPRGAKWRPTHQL